MSVSEKGVASSGESPFVDSMNVAGDRIQHPSWDDLFALERLLRDGHQVPFSLDRRSDRDAAMKFEYAAGQFAIVGAEDSVERGSFGFCYLDPTLSDTLIRFGPHEYPEYCTTGDLGQVIQIAQTFFWSGELERSVSWHVSGVGLGRARAMIPPSEILRAGGIESSLAEFLYRPISGWPAEPRTAPDAGR